MPMLIFTIHIYLLPLDFLIILNSNSNPHHPHCFIVIDYLFIHLLFVPHLLIDLFLVMKFSINLIINFKLSLLK